LKYILFKIEDGGGRHYVKKDSGMVRDICTKFGMQIKDIIPDHARCALFLVKFIILAAANFDFHKKAMSL